MRSMCVSVDKINRKIRVEEFIFSVVSGYIAWNHHTKKHLHCTFFVDFPMGWPLHFFTQQRSVWSIYSRIWTVLWPLMVACSPNTGIYGTVFGSISLRNMNTITIFARLIVMTWTTFCDKAVTNMTKSLDFSDNRGYKFWDTHKILKNIPLPPSSQCCQPY